MKCSELDIKTVPFFDIPSIWRASNIVFECGRDMSKRYGLHHWDNSRLLTFCIVMYGINIKKTKLWRVNSNNKTVATFQTKIKGNYLNFSKLAVSPASEGKGIGKECLNFMSSIALQNNLKGLSCEVLTDSSHALNFYLHNGFKEVGSISTLHYSETVLVKEF